MFGFYVSSLAIFSTSTYVADLYKIEEKNDSSKTLLHTLVQSYKLGLIAILLTILYLLFIQITIGQSDNDSIRFSDYRSLLFLFTVSFNFYWGYKMLSYLIQVIIQQAKRNIDYPPTN
jgi:hypothetical protein